MFNSKKNIKWVPLNYETELIVPAPKPSKTCIPEWYKNAPAWMNNKKEVTQYPDGQWDSNATFKKCIPFLDPFLTGYIQELWCDITFYSNGDRVEFTYNSTIPPINERKGTSYLSMGEMFYQQEFVWNTQWEPITPKGYSTLYTQPYNRINLPFYSLTGIIDTDVWSVPGNYPFLIYKGFSGTIPAGTPMYQMFPYKRDSWQSINLPATTDTENFIENSLKKLKSHVTDGYKKLYWSKKYYE